MIVAAVQWPALSAEMLTRIWVKAQGTLYRLWTTTNEIDDCYCRYYDEVA